MEAFTALAASAPDNLSPGQASGSGSSGNTPPSPSAGGGAAGGDGTTNGGAGGAASGTAGGNPAQATANSASGFSTQSLFSLGVAAFAAVVMF